MQSRTINNERKKKQEENLHAKTEIVRSLKFEGICRKC